MSIFVKKYLVKWLLYSTLLLPLIAMPACSNKEMTTSTGSTAQPQNVPSIPTEYSGIYTNLKAALGQFDSFLDKQGNPKNPTIFGAELLPANCNRGEDLLKPGVISAVQLYLDRLQELGVQGVTIPVHYPIYTPQFPHFTEYVSFYKQVVQEIRNRGMKLDIESHVLFANTPFSTVK